MRNSATSSATVGVDGLGTEFVPQLDEQTYDDEPGRVYPIDDDDPPELLARCRGLTTDDITSFNGDTTDPAEINRALATEVGDTRRASPSGDFEFSDEDEPGVVQVPHSVRLHGRPTDARQLLCTAPRRPSPQWVFSL